MSKNAGTFFAGAFCFAGALPMAFFAAVVSFCRWSALLPGALLETTFPAGFFVAAFFATAFFAGTS